MTNQTPSDLCSETTESATKDFDRDFTKPDVNNGWCYPLVFHNELDGNGEPKRLFVNQYVLSGISPIFRTIFFDKKYSDCSKTEGEVDGKTFDEFHEFLKCVAVTYDSYEQKQLDSHNLAAMLEYAEYYQMTALRQRCITFCDKVEVSNDNLEWLLSLADMYRLSLLRQRCISQKMVDTNNLLSLWAYAQEYDLRTLSQRCITFVQQQAGLDIRTKKNRQQIAQLFALASNSAIPPLKDLDLIEQMSRFPLPEIREISLNQPMLLNELLLAKTDRYSRLGLPAAAEKCRVVGAISHCCFVCGGAGVGFYFCRRCPLFNSCSRRTYFCFPCFDVHHVAAHKLLGRLCLQCDAPFTMSTDSEPDSCRCDAADEPKCAKIRPGFL